MCLFALVACASKSNAFVGSWQDADRTTGYVFQSNGVVTIGSDGLLHDNQAGMMKPIVLHRVSQVALGSR
jgi:hypothetical protein